MGYSSIDDVSTGDTRSHGVHGASHLREHTARDYLIGNELVHTLRSESGKRFSVTIQKARDISQQHQFLCLQHFCQLTRDKVGIDVVGKAISAPGHRRNDGLEGM